MHTEYLKFTNDNFSDSILSFASVILGFISVSVVYLLTGLTLRYLGIWTK